MMVGFMVGILSHELLKYNHNLTYMEAISIVQTVLKRHEGEPDTGTLWLMMIQEVEDAAQEYLVSKALSTKELTNRETANGREDESSTQSGT